MKHVILLVLLLSPVYAFSQQYTVETVPNTKLVNNSYVSNPDGIISTTTVQQIDSILYSLERNATAQVAVVLLNSIGDDDIFDFSQRLFNKWGIGQSQKDNGLLILLVRDKHTVRFHTGDGLEGILPDAVCKRIQLLKMVPAFKENRYDDGMLFGIMEVNKILTDPRYAIEIRDENISTDEDEPLYGIVFFMVLFWLIIAVITFLVKKHKNKFFNPSQPRETPAYRLSASSWFWRFIVIPVVIMIVAAIVNNAGVLFGGLYLYVGAMVMARQITMNNEAAYWLEKKEYQSLYNFYQRQKGFFNFMRFLFPVPLLFLYPAYKRKMKFFREHPRNCKNCGSVLNRLDDKSEDPFLSQGQLAEEDLKSVDYDVWQCSQCSANEQFVYINTGSKYKVCPKCNFYTFYSISRRTIQSATEYSEGTGEEVKECKFCNHRDVSTYSIPRVERSSSSSGGDSSSSGGSWGGGSSSGGGASSSW
jgi:uncharacterized protein